MDSYNIPRKVNRHVLTAMQFLSSGRPLGAPIKDKEIIDRVRFQMRRLIPVPRLGSVIKKSLKNMENLSIVSQYDPHHYTFNCDSRANMIQSDSPRENIYFQDFFGPIRQKKIKRPRSSVRCGNRGGWIRVPTDCLVEETFSEQSSSNSSISSTVMPQCSSSINMEECQYTEWSDTDSAKVDVNKAHKRLRDEFEERKFIEHTSDRKKRRKRAVNKLRKNFTKNVRNYNNKKIRRNNYRSDFRYTTDGIKSIASPRRIKQTPSSSYVLSDEQLQSKAEKNKNPQHEKQTFIEEYIWESSRSTIESDLEARIRVNKERDIFNEHFIKVPILSRAPQNSSKNQITSLNLNQKVGKPQANDIQSDLETQQRPVSSMVALALSKNEPTSLNLNKCDGKVQPSAAGGNFANYNQLTNSSLSENYNSSQDIILRYVR